MAIVMEISCAADIGNLPNVMILGRYQLSPRHTFHICVDGFSNVKLIERLIEFGRQQKCQMPTGMESLSSTCSSDTIAVGFIMQTIVIGWLITIYSFRPENVLTIQAFHSCCVPVRGCFHSWHIDGRTWAPNPINTLRVWVKSHGSIDPEWNAWLNPTFAQNSTQIAVRFKWMDMTRAMLPDKAWNLRSDSGTR